MRNRLNILTVGHLVEYKNPNLWIDLAVLMKQNMLTNDFQFTWVGEGPLLKQCRDKVLALGLESSINFVGPDNLISKYYSQCDIYLQLSHIESLGLSVLDAMRHGKPCVVAKSGGLVELVQSGKNGWVVDLNNLESIAAKINSLCCPNLREQMGRESMVLYEKKHSRLAWETNMWSIHKSLIKTSFA